MDLLSILLACNLYTADEPLVPADVAPPDEEQAVPTMATAIASAASEPALVYRRFGLIIRCSSLHSQLEIRPREAPSNRFRRSLLPGRRVPGRQSAAGRVSAAAYLAGACCRRAIRRWRGKIAVPFRA